MTIFSMSSWLNDAGCGGAIDGAIDGGWIIAGGIFVTGTLTVRLPVVKLCFSCCVSKSFAGLVLRAALVFFNLARYFTYLEIC